MDRRVLTDRELNRAALARQLLLERSRLTLPKAVEQMGFIQSQYAPSNYVALWTRVEGVSREDVTRAYERRTLVQGTLNRVTIHSVSRRDYWPTVAAVEVTRRDWWLRATRRVKTDAQMRRLADRVRSILETDGPTKSADMTKRLGIDANVWNGLGLWLPMIRVPPSGTWEHRRADLYGLAEDWVGPRPPELTAEDGIALLVRRYLGGFGPAEKKDIAEWAGLDHKHVDPVLATMTLRMFRDERGAGLVDLPRAPLPDPDTPAPVRFLPWWDAMLIGEARRARILDDEVRARMNTPYPQSMAVILVDGRVAGTWRMEKGRIDVDLFSSSRRASKRELLDEAERLQTFCA